MKVENLTGEKKIQRRYQQIPQIKRKPKIVAIATVNGNKVTKTSLVM